MPDPITNDVGIANLALTLIGETRITSLEDEVEVAIVVNSVYGATRDGLLTGHPWNFATTRATLAVVSGTPAFGFSNIHQKPANCLRILREESTKTKFQVENNTVLSNQSVIKVKYIFRQTDVTKYSAAFIIAFAAELAAILALKLGNLSAAQIEKARDNADDKMSEAKATDGQEGISDELEASEFIDSRSE